MQVDHSIPANNAALMREILPTPAVELVDKRFIESVEVAPCSGSCSSGVCRTRY